MHTTIRSALLLAAVIPALGIQAQIAFGGRAFGLMSDGIPLPQAALASLPSVDADALIAADEARYASGAKGPYRFGFNHTTDLGTDNSGTWHERENGDRIWRLSIACPGALSINFRFAEYHVPHGGLVFVYNELGDQLGAFTAASAAGRTKLGVTQLAGERITVEYYEPAAVAGLGSLHIDQVTHGYRDVFNMAKGFGDSGPCNINVICPEGDDWRDQIRSTAIITVGGDGFCTGSLLNTCSEDGTPYFLTADHCLDNDVESWVFRFNWDSPVCSPTQNAATDQTVSGCELLVNSAGTDVALLLLNSAPPAEYEVFYSGWYKGPVAAERVTSIHHPRGDIKKISHSEDPVIPGMMSGAECWHVQVWDAGTTEPGSSGSGLWNQEGLLVGQLFGGEANCNNNVNDFYGRLDVSWPLLEPYLGNCADAVYGADGSGSVGPVTNDAAVTSINNIPSLLCGTNEVVPRVTLKNNGTEVVTSIIVLYGVDGLPPAITTWTGSLLPGETVNYELPAVTVPSGEHIFIVASSSPNGLQDEFTDNDAWSTPIVVNFPAEEMTLRLQADDFGSDITWTLLTEEGTLLYSGGPYTDVDGGEFFELPFCLSNGCYTFTINDLFGDGICCENGEGSYSLSTADGTVYAESNGEYGLQDVQQICLANVSVQEREGLGTMALFPNPSNGRVHLQLSGMGGPVALSVLDGTGRMVAQLSLAAGTPDLELDLSGLMNGVYLVRAEYAQGSAVQRVMIQR
ncbi:MAG: trypsin-like peptidase domain-containing protein [Flavobacteriales bacterium]